MKRLLRHGNTINAETIRFVPDAYYRTASKFVYAFRRYIKPKRLASLLIGSMAEVMQNSFTDKFFSERITSLLAFSDV